MNFIGDSRSEYKGEKTMNHRLNLQQHVILFVIVALLLGAVILLATGGVNMATIRFPSLNAIDRSQEEVVDLSGQERAADLSAYRWQAMADFYENHGLLTRDNFDYEQAANNLAYRWQAMARFYEKNGILTRDNFDYEQAANNLAYRWQAMARFYEKNGMLTRDATPISAAVVGYAERLNAGDMDGALAFFDDNAVFYILGLPPEGFERLNGKEQIGDMFEENIASHFKMEVKVLSAVDNVVTAHVTTWHDFTREIGAAPIEATSIYVIKDSKITSGSWQVSGESLARLKTVLAEMEAEGPASLPYQR
jgi:hypothetical protein